MNWLFDRLPYERLGDFKFAHFLLAGLGVGFLIFVLYFFTLYNVNSEKYASLQTKKSQTEQKLVNYRNLIAEKDDVSTRLVSLQGQLDQEKNQIPKGKDIPGILRRAADIGNYLGLDILLFQVDKEKDKDYYKEIPIEIKIRGDFYKTSGFLDAMQNLLQLVDVSKYKMEITAVPIVRPKAALKVKNASLLPKTAEVLQTTINAKTYTYVEGAEEKAVSEEKKS